MKKASHSKKKLSNRVRAGAIAVVCFVAVFALVVAVGVAGKSVPRPEHGSLDSAQHIISNPGGVSPETQTDDTSDKNTVPKSEISQTAFEDSTGPISSVYIPPDEELPPHENDVVLIEVAKGTSAADLERMLQDVDGISMESVNEDALNIGLVALQITDGSPIMEIAARLERVEGIDAAQPNFIYTIAESSSSAAPNSASRSSSSASTSSSNESLPTLADESSLSSVSATSSASSRSSSSSSATDAAPVDESSTSISAASTEVNDPYTDSDNSNGYQWGLSSVHAYEAWDTIKCGESSSPVGIAIIDTGVDEDHVDLDNNIVKKITVNYTINNDGDAIANGITENSAPDDNGHGTHVAGIASAETNNGEGVAGISYNAKLVILKANYSQNGKTENFSTSTMARAYEWLLAKSSNDSSKTNAQYYNVRVINMSIGGKGTLGNDTALAKRIDSAKSANILTVCAAGNKSSSDPAYDAIPGDYSNCLSVMNLEKSSSWSDANNAVRLSSQSNYNTSGSTAKDICAPGTNIYSTTYNGSYGSKDGTSMASPLVAGVAALVFQRDPSLTPDKVMDILENTATDLGAEGWDETYGFGEVDAAKAVEAVGGASIDGERVILTSGSSTYTASATDGSSNITWTWSLEDTGNTGSSINASDGTLTAGNRTGTVVVKVSAGSSYTASMEVSIISDEINGDDAIFESGSKKYSAASELRWIWSVDNSSIAYIGSMSGTLVGRQAGTVTITATCASNANIKLTKSVAVVAAPSWSYSEIIYSGLADTCSYTYNSSTKYTVNNVETALTWSWSLIGENDAAYASIDASTGLLTAKAAGSVTLALTCDQFSCLGGATTIHIDDPYITGNSVTVVGNSGTYTVVSANKTGSTASCVNSIDWSVDNEQIATIARISNSFSSKLTGKSSGTVAITATIHGDNNTSISINMDVIVNAASINGPTCVLVDSQATYEVSDSDSTWIWSVDDADNTGSSIDSSTGVLSAGNKTGTVTITATNANDSSQTASLEAQIMTASINGADVIQTCSYWDLLFDSYSNGYSVASSTDDATWSYSASSDTLSWGSYAARTDGSYVYIGACETGTITLTLVCRQNTDIILTKQITVINPSINGPSTITYGDSENYSISNGNGSSWTWTSPNASVATLATDSNNTSVSTLKTTGAGTTTITATCNENQSIKLTKNITINRATIAVPSARSGLTYTGSAQTGVASGSGYALSGTTSATNAGTHTAYATPDSNHQWTDGSYTRKTITWTIARRSLSNAAVSGSYTYTGSAIRPSVTVTASGASGSPTYSTAYSNNVNAGTGYVTVKGTGNYTGTKTTGFTINRRNIAEANISVNNQTYTGGALTPNPTVTRNGRTLSNGSDYRTSYANNTNVGTATVTVTGTGNYTGSTSKNFEITAGGVPMYRLYNPNSGEHFYTASVGERDMLVGVGWRYEGVGWTAPSTSNTPVYRMYNTNGGEHHYTMSAGERDMLVSVGWNYEGIGWYSNDQQRVALFRDYNPNAFANNHNYTTSAAEHEMLMSVGWSSEGYAWYGM